MLSIRSLRSFDAGFEDAITEFINQSSQTDSSVSNVVKEIIADIRNLGDSALLGYVAEHDKITVGQAADLRLTKEQINECAEAANEAQVKALQSAALNIEEFAHNQKLKDYSVTKNSTQLSQRITPIESVGLYVPGGRAVYPSSVLMNAIPAKVAGVERIVAVTPAPAGTLNPLVAYALRLTGVEEVYTIGGAHAVAVLAYGSETIAPVKKIVGPGNAYVAEAKRQVYGRVGIDMPAGPSEVLIICDATTDPAWIARDLCAQAEHDELACSILICDQADYFAKVTTEIEKFVENTPRKKIINTSLSNRGLFIQTKTLKEAAQIANRIAPEHLELSVSKPDELLNQIHNAGAIFLGAYSSEVVGDYCAGPNHVLPTGGSAAFSSPLGVYDFQKRSNIIQCSQDSANVLGGIAKCLAEAEGLFAHAESAKCRMLKSD